jgi:excisionase family DNA binding protein
MMNKGRGEDEGQADEPAEGPQFLHEDMKSVKEAADLLKVSESTVWRYADQDLLPSYRLGPKQVRFKVSDLESLIYRVPRRKKQPAMSMTERLRLTTMNVGAVRETSELIARATSLRADILARRGGVVVSDSADDINASREERSADL